MPAQKKIDLTGNTPEAKARRARHAASFSPFGPGHFHTIDAETRREWHRKGIAKVHANQQKRKSLSSMMKTFLDQPASAEVAVAYGLDNLFPDLKPEQITFGMLLTASVGMRGIAKGEGSQYAVIRDTIGEKPKDSLTVTGEDGQPLNPPVVHVSFLEELKKEIS